ncbi:MAG: EpsG family protein [Lachnospiraceae bacterium]|nr:EpsG family protein [Lachnospiraceae bacterium]
MAIYLIMLVVSVFFASCARKLQYEIEYRKAYYVYGLLSVLPFLVVSAIRYRVGTDWYIYDRYFHAIHEGTNSFREPLFNLLNRIIYLFTDNSQFLFIAVAIITLGFTFTAIYQQSRYIPFSIILYFLSTIYFNSLNQMRQAIAMSIFLYASRYIWDRKCKKYMLWILVAMCFHVSALIYVPVYFLYGWRAEIKKHIVLFGVIIVSMPVLKVVIVAVLKLTPYAWYFDSAYSENDFLLAGFIISFLLLVFMEYYNYVGNVDDDKTVHFMVNMQWLCLVSLLCTAFIPQVSRISSALEIISILAIPRMILFEKKRNQRIIVYCLIVALLTTKLVYNVYVCGFFDVVPFQTISSM